MSSPVTNRVTAQDFYDFDKCPHRVHLNRFGDPKEKLPQSEFLNLLFENALIHERDVIEGMPYAEPRGETLDERALSTLQLMRTGVDRIYQGVLLCAKESGIPDLLERVSGKSNLGSYFYKPVDIKSGSGYENEEKGTLREDYGMQLYHYGELLEVLVGEFPPEGEILNRDKLRIRYPLDQFKASYNATIPEVRALITGSKCDEPACTSACGTCQWWGHCESLLVASNDVSLLPDIGRSKKTALNSAGISSIADIPGFNFAGIKLKGIGVKTIDSMKRSAISVLSNKLQVIGKEVIPDPPRKIYLDFEDDPTQGLIYLCGMWIEPAWDDLNYHGLFCTDHRGERKLWDRLQQFCASIASEDYVVFHYAPYEKTKLTAFERKYGSSKKGALDLFKSRMVDLLPLVKRSVVLPAKGYGLKRVAPFVGIEYSAANAGGAQSIVWFQTYQKDQTNRDVLQTLLTYNKEDCLAMVRVEDWLRKL